MASEECIKHSGLSFYYRFRLFSQADEGSVNPSLSEETERLAQMEQLVSQLKEMIREKDAALRTKDEQFKVINSTWLHSEYF